jgi:[FeFe] hydrogenase H-cluster maturation GTPase HydF
MSAAYKGERLHIAVLGRCNTGKSTVLNFLAGQQAAIVSPKPGTTGDPVALSFELPPFGPVTFYDTAGLDEVSELGELRRKAGLNVLARADMALVVTDEAGIGPCERETIASLRALDTPLLVLFNKDDVRRVSEQDKLWCAERDIPYLCLSARAETDPVPLREALIPLAPDPGAARPLVRDILPGAATVVCITPIDASAPKGRLIAPQVQVLRELVEHGHVALVAQPGELGVALRRLRRTPDLIITDSQAVREVNDIIPPAASLTTFSVLFARYKGDFSLLLEGTRVIDRLGPEDEVLIAEACSHHVQDDDIARIKLPGLLKRHSGVDVRFSFCAGRDFPDDLERFSLVVHCGGCMLNPGEMRRRLRHCAAAGVPVSNFGMAISLCQGVLDRVSAPFLPKPPPASAYEE